MDDYFYNDPWIEDPFDEDDRSSNDGQSDVLESDEEVKCFLIKPNNKKEEWLNYRPARRPTWCEMSRWRDGTTPLLISECQCLEIKRIAVPNKTGCDQGEVSKRKMVYRAHPKNMPDVPLGVIELVGTILRRHKSYRYLLLDVYDGTGIMNVRMGWKRYKEEIKNRKKIDRSFRMTPELLETVPRIMKKTVSVVDGCSKFVREIDRYQRTHKAWWTDTNKGMLGMELEIGDYVNIYGYCALEHHPGRKWDSSTWNSGMRPKMVFVAGYIDVIDEATYGKKFQEIVEKGIKKYE